MSALTRFDRFDDLFPELFRRLATPLSTSDDTPGEIRIDVTEHDKDYQVRAAMPGVKKEDVHVMVDGNVVSIAAEVKQEKEEKSGGRVLSRETYMGRVSRTFSLAHEIESQGAVAKLEDGILNLTLPKREGGGSKAISIQ